ncbi:hypothetical protein ACT3SP_08745 [Brachybacterium sp. AOP43-C2-M15]|uniref:hypothetical protein n=1 Tax=Brachybacterium sp. AOP43-C2-M15 TaxID=3457661 RepID=UPI004033598B
MPVVRSTLQILRTHLRAYLLANLLMYGLVLGGFALGLAVPELAAGRATALEEDGTADLVGRLLSNVWLFAVTILGVNAITVGLFSIVLPSLVIPFAGIVIFACRAVVIGVTLAPTDPSTWIVLIPHSLTLVIEFQAYILLVLGVYLLGRAWITPAFVGETSRVRAYGQGLRLLGRLGLAALVLLVVGALYEAFTLRYLVPVMLR